MILQDLIIIFRWWLVLAAMGVVFLPLTFRIFPKFFDRGYAFSKTIAILITSYLVWLLGSLRVLPFGTAGIWLVLLVGVGGNLYLFLRSSKERSPKEKSLGNSGFFPSWQVILFEEFLFLLCLVGWSLVRGFLPDIHGLEKFMDQGFVNSILRSQYFPPKDLWFAGETLNYYYFGHLVAAVLTKLSGIASVITYNLMIATIFALSFTTSFSLGANLISLAKSFSRHSELGSESNGGEKGHRTLKPFDPDKSGLQARQVRGDGVRRRNCSSVLGFIGGLLSALLVNLGGNLHTLWYFLTKKTLSTYWYPDATRFIVEKFGAADNTIHEFPFYSFVVADLHGHFSDIPFVLLFLALLLRFAVRGSFPAGPDPLQRPPALSVKRWDRRGLNPSSVTMVSFGLVLAVMLMTNPWDFPIYGLLFALVLLWTNVKKCGWSFKTCARTFAFGLPVAILAFVFSLPFHLNFEQIAQGVGLVHARSPFWQLLVLWGFSWLAGLTFLIFNFKKKLLYKLRPEGLIKALARLFDLKIKLLEKVSPPKPISCHNGLVLIFIGVATLLIIIPEIIYVKDIYISSHHRANTMFKLTYQAFILYGLATAYTITRVLVERLRHLRSRLVLFAPYLLCLVFITIYPYKATKTFYGLETYKGLDGLRWLEERYPDDYAAILWLRESANFPESDSRLRQETDSSQPVILEAVGESYTDYARVSANTGLPTVLGWPVHEWLWRGSYDEPGKRREEVRKMYESASIDETRRMLNQYQVRYIFVGALEGEQYKGLKEDKFKKIAKPVFKSGETTIYEL